MWRHVQYRRWQYTTAVATDHRRWRGCHGHRHSPSSTHEALALKAPLFTWSVKLDFCYNVLWLCSTCCMKQMLWSSLQHALAQMRPHQICTRTLSKNGLKYDHFGRSLEPCIKICIIPFWVCIRFTVFIECFSCFFLLASLLVATQAGSWQHWHQTWHAIFECVEVRARFSVNNDLNLVFFLTRRSSEEFLNDDINIYGYWICSYT